MTKAHAAAVSVVIPTYNGVKLLQKHLPGVLSILDSGDEVVIVDDHSSDQTITWLTEKFNLVSKTKSKWGNVLQGETSKIVITLLEQEENHRFGASSNHGVEIAIHSLILLLNNDVEPLPGLKQQLIKYFKDETVFAVGCLEYEQTVGDHISGKNQLFFRRGLFQHRRADSMTSGPTAWVSGGSGMFSKQKWQVLGGFDPRFYPAYWEDIDLSHRARKRGWQVLFAEEAQVIHQHESTHQEVFGQKKMTAISWKNAFLFTRLHAEGLQKIWYWLWLPYWWWKK